jgi:hypothetical protein
MRNPYYGRVSAGDSGDPASGDLAQPGVPPAFGVVLAGPGRTELPGPELTAA